jgi:hypothetical protein
VKRCILPKRIRLSTNSSGVFAGGNGINGTVPGLRTVILVIIPGGTTAGGNPGLNVAPNQYCVNPCAILDGRLGGMGVKLKAC